MLQRVLDEISKWLPWSPTLRVVMLSVVYETGQDEAREEFLRDFRSRLQLTYRRGFSTPLKLLSKEISSDAGWGCMLRVMQMILAQSFITFTLGREWRFEEERDFAQASAYMDVMKCFLDSPKAPFSLHSLVDAGQRLLGKEPSTWFGPTSAAKAAGSLFDSLPSGSEAEEHVPAFLRRLACAVFEDGAIFKASVLEKFESRGCEAVIILVCRRLGLEAFNVEVYREGVEACFELPEFQGLASGNSASSAHFFVASHDDSLLFIDPHQTQPALESLESLVSGGASAAGLQPSRPLPLKWSRLNPSVCIGFLVRSPQEFLALCDKLSDSRRGEVFEVAERQPVYKEPLDTAVEDEEGGGMVLCG